MKTYPPLELCKKLYKLSNWGHNFQTDNPGDIYAVNANGEAAGILSTGGFALADMNDLAPAYSLDYLIDKLTEVKTGLTIYHVHSTMQYECFYAGKFFEYGTDEQHWDLQGSTPAEAACKLAIKLFEEGILKK